MSIQKEVEDMFQDLDAGSIGKQLEKENKNHGRQFQITQLTLYVLALFRRIKELEREVVDSAWVIR